MPFRLSLRLGIRVGSTKQPPLPPALPAPHWQAEAALWLFCDLPPPGEPCLVAWLWTAQHMETAPSILAVAFISKLSENRGTGETEEGERPFVWGWPGLPALPSVPSPHSTPHRSASCPSLSPGPFFEGQPHTAPSPFLPLPPGVGTLALPCWREA